MGLRILMASDFYPPFIGGAERQIQLLGHELVLRGHKVSMATVWHAGLPEQQNDYGVSVHRLQGLSTRVPWFSKDSARRFHPPFPDLSIVRGLQKIIKLFQPDLIHAQGWIAYSCATALGDNRIPLVISARDYGYGCPTRTLLNHGQICQGPAPLKCLNCSSINYGFPKAIAATIGVLSHRRMLARKVSAIHSVSAFVQYVMSRDLPGAPAAISEPRRITIADITSDSSQEATTDHNESVHLPAEPYILFVGALQANKGLGVLLAAYQQLSSPPPLVLIGSKWHDTPKQFPSGVTVLYNAPHDLVMYAWKRCLFGVAPSVWPDPLPGVVREAMCCGKPVIATAVGGIVDMISSGETGLLIPPGDVNALAAAMSRLIGDAELREGLGRAGQENVKRFRAESVVPQFEMLYRELIEESRENKK